MLTTPLEMTGYDFQVCIVVLYLLYTLEKKVHWIGKIPFCHAMLEIWETFHSRVPIG